MAVDATSYRGMAQLLYRLGRASVRRRRLVLFLWIAAAVVITVVGQASGGSTSDTFKVPGTEAHRAVDVLQRDAPAVSGAPAQVVCAAARGPLAAPGPAAAVEQARTAMSGQPHVTD